jgi:hypothetical protein
VIPNAERDDFETSQAYTALELAVAETLKRLEEDVEKFQERGVAADRVKAYRGEIEGLELQLETIPSSNPYETYSRLDEIIIDLKRQKTKAITEDKKAAEDLLHRAKAIQKQVRSTADSPEPEAKRRKRSVKPDRSPIPEQGEQAAAAPSPVPRTLPEVLNDAGWSVEGDVERLARVVQESMEGVLGITSGTYQTLINQIELRLVGDDTAL